MPGNHDVGNSPSRRSFRSYRERFGEDHYAFDHKGCRFVAMDSAVCFDPINVPDAWEAQLRFLTATLGRAKRTGRHRILVFSHHPLFLHQHDAEDS